MAETAIVVLVPEAEPLVGEHRRRHTEDGAHGIGAHVTLLYPFADASLLDLHRLGDVSDALAAFESFDFALATPNRFPGNPRVLCLRPEPDAPFRAMTAALVAAFPEHRPYGGKYDDPIPHATVAVGDDDVLDPIERELASALPIPSRATEAVVMERDEHGRWRPHSRLPFL
jgi:2'-5' RNA ligase superfamily